MAELAGRVAVITGASRGIGRAIAKALSAEGMQLALCFHEHVSEAEAVLAELASSGADVQLIQADLADPGAPQLIVASARARFERVDCLINNAGISSDGTLPGLPMAAYEEVLRVNFVAAAMLAQAAVDDMIAAGFGRIVNIASFVAHTGVFGASNYAAAKSALIAWTKSAAREWARHGVTVNVVSPGYIQTDMLNSIPPVVLERLVKQIPMGHFGAPADVAAAVVFALKSDYMTGGEIAINGGIYM